MEDKFRENLKTYIIAGSISFGIGLAFLFIFWFAAGLGPLDGLSLSAVILLASGGLMFVTNEGLFDSFAYGFKQVGKSLFGKKGNEENDFVGYKTNKQEMRSSKPKIFVPVLLVGCLFLVVFIIVRIAFIF